MALSTITTAALADKGVRGLPDVPGLASGVMQRRFDELTLDVVVPAFNGLVSELAAADGAQAVGCGGTTVAGALADLNAGLAAKADAGAVLLTDGSTAFTPRNDNDPVNKKYVDDAMLAAGAGDMCRSVYDADNDGVVDKAAALIGTLSIAGGGTGADTAAAARGNLGVLGMAVVESLPETPAAGTVYFVYGGA